MSIVRLSPYGHRQLPLGPDQPSGAQLRFDGTTEKKRPYFRPRRPTSALAQKPARHEFAIEDLGQARWLTPHRYRYFCIRCRWLFLIENRLGDATAVDESGQPLREPEQGTRVATFALGPCPAALREIEVLCEKRGSRYRLTHSTEEHQRENVKSRSTPLRTLLIRLRTALTKRHSSRHFVLVRGRQ
jgi:hypothetical protein